VVKNNKKLRSSEGSDGEGSAVKKWKRERDRQFGRQPFRKQLREDSVYEEKGWGKKKKDFG